MDVSLMIERAPDILAGIPVTLGLVSLSLLFGGIAAIGFAIMRMSSNPVLSGFSYGYVFVFRGTPLLVQIFLIYYGIGQFEAVRESFAWPVLRDAYWCAIIALAMNTAADPLLRMALVPRVMEARGLDVTPGMMERFAAIGDQQTVDILDLILREEIGHVEAGSRWFRELCAARGLDPEDTYFDLLEQHLGGNIRCPLHIAARRQAGFTDSELGRLEALCKKS